jgi:hypothetical protein
VIKKLAPVFVCLSLVVSARAQTIDDGIMVGKRSLFTGDLYGYETRIVPVIVENCNLWEFHIRLSVTLSLPKVERPS